MAFLSLSLWNADAQDRDSLAFAAAEYELRLYDCPPDETLGLLMAKAGCQQEAGMWTDALETFRRIPMFAMDGPTRTAVVTSMLSCLYMSGQYEEFMTTVDEAMLTGIFGDKLCADLESYLVSNPIKSRSEDVALLLSAVPGFGHFYAGKPVQGIGHLALNGAVIAAGIASFCSGLYVCAFLGGGMVLARTHTGNSASAVKAVAEYNSEVLRKRCEAVLGMVMLQDSELH